MIWFPEQFCPIFFAGMTTMPIAPARSFMRRVRGHTAMDGPSSPAPAREAAVISQSVRAAVGGCAIGLSVVLWVAAAAARTPGAPPSASSEKPRALLDRYCIGCHNDRLKTANLSLQGLDLTKATEQAEVWEKVIRKLRAGVMPPPDIPRPPLPDYEELRDWLENEIDRAAPATTAAGSVVLHRLNRTEYANAIRDLLDLQIDATTLLPPDDSAHGFDNIAGSLTISPTLLESYGTAAARIVRMAIGSWKSPSAGNVCRATMPPRVPNGMPSSR